MRRPKNATVYTGRVGVKMKPRSAKLRRRPVLKTRYRCSGGPLDGLRIKLEMNSGDCTLPIIVRGQVGLYRLGAWEPIELVARHA